MKVLWYHFYLLFHLYENLYLLCWTDNLAIWFGLFFRGITVTKLITYRLVLSSRFSPISNSIESYMHGCMITHIHVYVDLSAYTYTLMVIPLQYTTWLPAVVKLILLL